MYSTVVSGFPLQYISCYFAETWIAFLTVYVECELTHRLREFVTKTSALGVLVIESYGPNQMTAKYLGDIFVKNILQTCLLV